MILAPFNLFISGGFNKNKRLEMGVSDSSSMAEVRGKCQADLGNYIATLLHGCIVKGCNVRARERGWGRKC